MAEPARRRVAAAASVRDHGATASRDSASCEKPLTPLERLYGQRLGCARPLILVVLAVDLGGLRALPRQPAAVPDLHRHARGVLRAHRRAATLPAQAWTSIKVLLMGYALGIVLAALLTALAIDDAHRHRPARDADRDVQPAAGDRAAAAGADLVRPRQRQPRLRAGALGAVGGRAQHAFGLPRRCRNTLRMVGRNYGLRGFALHRARS